MQATVGTQTSGNPNVGGPNSGSPAPRSLSAQNSSAKIQRMRRRTANTLMWICSIGAVIAAVVPLALVLYYILSRGLPMLNLEFFTGNLPTYDAKAGGGMKNAMVGTLILIGLACCLGVPLGILGGIYLAEYGNNRLGFAVRFAADVLNGIPSIVIGIFVYAIAVFPVARANPGSGYSALAGGLALGIMMIPTIMRTTEEILKLVPMALREASLALGATRSRTTLKVVLSAARGGVITGVLLAIARVAGETAPLLFTALGNDYFSTNLKQPIGALPIQIYNFATSASNYWNAMAWAGALVLVLFIFILSVLARHFTAQRETAK
jgi:phosphate transport system permease protein